MKKPKKKGENIIKAYDHFLTSKEKGYNFACDDWEKWLQSVKSLKELIMESQGRIINDYVALDLAKAISKRIKEV